MVPQTNWLPVSLLTTTKFFSLGALLGRGPVRSGAFPPPWLTSNVSPLQMLFVQHLLTTRFAQPENITCPARLGVVSTTWGNNAFGAKNNASGGLYLNACFVGPELAK